MGYLQSLVLIQDGWLFVLLLFFLSRGYFGIAVLPCQLRFGAGIHGVDKAM